MFEKLLKTMPINSWNSYPFEIINKKILCQIHVILVGQGKCMQS